MTSLPLLLLLLGLSVSSLAAPTSEVTTEALSVEPMTMTETTPTTTTTKPVPTTTTTTNAPTTTTTTPVPTVTRQPSAIPISNVLQVAEANGASRFANLAYLSNLKDRLSSQGPFTLFAPSDDAFDLLDERKLIEIVTNPLLLDALIGQHAALGDVRNESISNEQLVDSVAGVRIRLNVYSSVPVTTASGSPISKVDQRASNGVVHIIDKVIYPPPRANIIEELALEKKFQRLADVIQLTELADILGGDQPYTLFAPTDKAIGKLGSKEWERITENVDLLEKLLRFHTVNGTFHDPALVDGTELTSIDEEKIRVTDLILDSGKLVNGAAIDRELQLPTTNGVVHGIDSFMFIPVTSKNVKKMFKHDGC